MKYVKVNVSIVNLEHVILGWVKPSKKMSPVIKIIPERSCMYALQFLLMA